MYDWNYTPDHPINLTLCADARLSPTDSLNDQIWELNIGNSEPPAISFQTTFGLRARHCRIFPRFTLKGKVVNDPSEFHHPVTIRQYFPNYLKLTCKPFPSINVQIEYWVPNSQTIAGLTTAINTSHETCQLQIDWAELLIPGAEGHRMAIQELGLMQVLSGEVSGLTPVFLLSGANQAGKSPYPSLSSSFSLPSHGEHTLQWVQASLADLQSSFGLAKIIINKNWDAEFSRIIRVNSENIEVTTGYQDWNTAFYLSQVRANQLILRPTSNNKPATFINQRTPDQGFSFLEDDSDYTQLWNGASLLKTSYLSSLILPSSSEFLRVMLDNYLSAQSLGDETNNKPNASGQRSRLFETPLLSTLSWQLYEFTGDMDYLKRIYPLLLSSFFSWFSEDHDRDGDLFPEWGHNLQTGFEANPHFSYVSPKALGIDISTIESPDLSAYLYNECQSLISIATVVGEPKMLSRLEELADRLKEGADRLWNDQHACFMFRDRDSHVSTAMQQLSNFQGSGIIDIHKTFEQPVRLIIHIKTKKEGTNPTQIYIHGILPNNIHRVEHITSMQGHWQPGYGYFTSQNTFQEIEHIQVLGAVSDDHVSIMTSGYLYLDQTGLLPLWAGLVSKERAKILINLSIMNKKKYLSTHGLRANVDITEKHEIPDEFSGISWLWTGMILSGLVRYGEKKNAAEIFSRTMKNVIHTLEKDLNFYQFYHAETGQPMGLVNSLTSLVPIDVFLKIIGVKIINSTKVRITGSNPFPWPVSIKYRGLTVIQQERRAIIIFPNGQNTTVDNSHPQTVSLEN